MSPPTQMSGIIINEKWGLQIAISRARNVYLQSPQGFFDGVGIANVPQMCVSGRVVIPAWAKRRILRLAIPVYEL